MNLNSNNDTLCDEVEQKKSYKRQIAFLICSVLCFTAIQDLSYLLMGSDSVSTALYIGNYVGYLLLGATILYVSLQKNTVCSLDNIFIKKLVVRFLLPVTLLVFICVKSNIPYGLTNVLTFMGQLSPANTFELFLCTQLDRYLAMVQPTLNLLLLAVFVVIPVNFFHNKTAN